MFIKKNCSTSRITKPFSLLHSSFFENTRNGVGKKQLRFKKSSTFCSSAISLSGNYGHWRNLSITLHCKCKWLKLLTKTWSLSQCFTKPLVASCMVTDRFKITLLCSWNLILYFCYIAEIVWKTVFLLGNFFWYNTAWFWLKHLKYKRSFYRYICDKKE